MLDYVKVNTVYQLIEIFLLTLNVTGLVDKINL